MKDKSITSVLTSQLGDTIKKHPATALLSKIYNKISFQVEGGTVEQKIESLSAIFKLSAQQNEALKHYYLHSTDAALPSLAARQAFFNEKISDLNRESAHVSNMVIAAVTQFLFINPYTELTSKIGLTGGVPYLRTGIAAATLAVAGFARLQAESAKNALFKGLKLMPQAPVEPQKSKGVLKTILRHIPIVNLFMDWGYNRALRQYQKDREAYLMQSKQSFDQVTDGHRRINAREKYLYAPTYLINATSSFGSSEFIVQTGNYVPGLGHAIDIVPGITAYFAALMNTGWNGYQTHKSFNSNRQHSQDRIIAAQSDKIKFLEKELGL